MTVLNAKKITTLTGAEVIVETLKRLNVDTVFGYPGGTVLSIYDELYKQKDIKHYLVRHEQAAVHAAEGYARVSGKCGVVLVTSGPGVSNTISGLANAWLDGYPVVVLSGQVAAPLIGKNSFQEVNIIDITKSCTKAGFQITSAEQLEKTLIKAFNCAISGKKGPVVVDMAVNIFDELCELKDEYNLPDKNYEIDGDIFRVLNEIKTARHPVITAGGGVIHANAAAELFKFVKKLNIPVVSTMMGLGAYPQDDENYLGMIGIFGDTSANMVLKNSDLIFSIGARFNDRITCCFKNGELERKFIRLDINKTEISKNFCEYMSLTGDANIILTKMNNMLKEYSCHNTWMKEAVEFKKLNNKPCKISGKLHSFEVIRELYNYTKNMDMVVTTEVGQHQICTARHYKFNKPAKFITSGGSGTMGFGLPAAIGASAALGRKPVLCITGDGSFQMNAQELAVCKDYKLPVKIFILNNGYLGMVRQLQQKKFGGRYYETKISAPDFLILAKAYNIPAVRVENFKDIRPALDKAFSYDGAYIIDFVTEPMEVI